MPKSTLFKSSKKKKYNARFPPARIKKIMQMDEEVGKVAAAVPVIISRALEMFIESIVTETSKVTNAKNAKTLSTSHIKQTIKCTKQFDFLRDLVKNVPDHQTEDNGDANLDGETSGRKSKTGRPRAIGNKRKSGGNRTSSDEDEEEEEEEDEEDTETDEESTGVIVSNPAHASTSSSHLQHHQHHASPVPLPPSMPANPLGQEQLSHHNHNNNGSYVPLMTGPTTHTVRDSLISGNNSVSPMFQQHGLPTSQQALVPPSSHSLYQIQSNNNPPQSFSSHHPLSSKEALYNPYPNTSTPLSNHLLPAAAHHHPHHIQSPVSQKLSQQQQAIDLSKSFRPPKVVDDEDDYDT